MGQSEIVATSPLQPFGLTRLIFPGVKSTLQISYKPVEGFVPIDEIHPS